MDEFSKSRPKEPSEILHIKIAVLALPSSRLLVCVVCLFFFLLLEFQTNCTRRSFTEVALLVMVL